MDEDLVDNLLDILTDYMNAGGSKEEILASLDTAREIFEDFEDDEDDEE